MSERDVLIDAAAALLKAAILHRDMMGAMPPSFYASMPEDIRNRLGATYYQDSFDQLPSDIQDAAIALLDLDPDVKAARIIGGGT